MSFCLSRQFCFNQVYLVVYYWIVCIFIFTDSCIYISSWKEEDYSNYRAQHFWLVLYRNNLLNIYLIVRGIGLDTFGVFSMCSGWWKLEVCIYPTSNDSHICRTSLFKILRIIFYISVCRCSDVIYKHCIYCLQIWT